MSEETRPKLLLVDDEEHVRVSLRDYLNVEGFNVAMAASGEEALDMLQMVSPDLIILDVSMPGIGGVGFLKRIVDEDGKSPYPVIVLTARSQMKEFFEGLSVDAFFAKPCDGGELCLEIRQVLARTANTRAQAARTKTLVLLAEEDDKQAAELIRLFGSRGVDVVRALSGPEVLEKAPSLKPSVIVLKQIMTLMNGTAVAQLIKVMPSMAGTPIVLYHEDPNFKPTADIREDVMSSSPDRIFQAVMNVI